MSSNEDEYLDESELFTKIINTFLMDGLKSTHNKELAKNALILLLNLYDDYPPDLFSTLGDEIEALSDEDRDEAMDKLKDIFLHEEE